MHSSLLYSMSGGDRQLAALLIVSFVLISAGSHTYTCTEKMAWWLRMCPIFKQSYLRNTQPHPLFVVLSSSVWIQCYWRCGLAWTAVRDLYLMWLISLTPAFPPYTPVQCCDVRLPSNTVLSRQQHFSGTFPYMWNTKLMHNTSQHK